ncbi:unnamed protein product [Prorocentrum cordatum]|uniref:RING-type domain-containing protein n=1 Tax=Prorocentrum cordatum TaxID=2364126 RepID=A0ABN9WU79_9DINO|nr:unnamed protein product [Polarella glacialis]
MQPGDTIVASNRLYGGSLTQFGKTVKKFNWGCTFVDVGNFEQVETALKDPTARLLFWGSLANPGGVVSDLRTLADLAHGAGVPLVVDNTLATPFLCRPIDHGADISGRTSTTKFLSGQGSALGGVVVDSGKFDWMAQAEKFPSLAKPEPGYHGLVFAETFGDMAFTMFSHAVGLRDLGATMAPLHAFLTLNGCETLAVRMERHCANAAVLAQFLERHPKVAWVSFAGLASSPYRTLAERYMHRSWGGGVFTFGVVGGFDAGVRVVEAVELFSHLANVGLTDEQRHAAGAGDDVIRLSIGLETPEDLIADLSFALDQAKLAIAALRECGSEAQEHGTGRGRGHPNGLTPSSTALDGLLRSPTAPRTTGGHPLAADAASGGGDLCVVCLSSTKTHAFLPCGHRCVCAECGSAVADQASAACPICRILVDHVLQIFC